jgi:hypothetical protein
VCLRNVCWLSFVFSLFVKCSLITELHVSTRGGHHQVHILYGSYCTFSMQTMVSCIRCCFCPHKILNKIYQNILLILKLKSLKSLKWCLQHDVFCCCSCRLVCFLFRVLLLHYRITLEKYFQNVNRTFNSQSMRKGYLIYAFSQYATFLFAQLRHESGKRMTTSFSVL